MSLFGVVHLGLWHCQAPQVLGQRQHCPDAHSGHYASQCHQGLGMVDGFSSRVAGTAVARELGYHVHMHQQTLLRRCHFHQPQRA